MIEGIICGNCQLYTPVPVCIFLNSVSESSFFYKMIIRLLNILMLFSKTVNAEIITIKLFVINYFKTTNCY
jgi:hypothetical protein